MDLTLNKVKHPDFLSGGGEMGERIRNFDWTKTPLGDPETWEQSLKTCVRIMLTSSQPIWIGWGKDLIKLYNDPYRAIVGGKHPLALGQPASVVWKEIWNDIEPLLRGVMEKNESTYVESQLLIMQRYGYPEEVYYTFSYSPVPGDDGHTAGMICFNTPETERIINERSIQTLRDLGVLTQKKNLREVYEETVKILNDNNRDFPFSIISSVSDDGDMVTPVSYAGITKDHSQLSRLFSLDQDKETGKLLNEVITENKLVHIENRGDWKEFPTGVWPVQPSGFVHVPIKAANKRIPIAILTAALNPYRKFDETYRNFIQLVADQVSLEVNNILAYEAERKRAEQLAELDKAKTVFFTNISHEFRTPLTLMLGPLEELIRKPDHLSDKEKNNIEATHRNAMRLLKLVNTLLDFSRIEAGRQQGNFSLVNIASVTKNIASNFRSVMEKAGLEFDVQADSINRPVYLDLQMWEKILFNLLSNAFKYTLQGKITVQLSAEGNLVVLRVKDTGVGIPANELPRMFERFHRIENSAGRTFEGTGIGLSLVKELVNIHSGTIEVESKLGEGSIFTVKIPFGPSQPGTQYVDEGNNLIEDYTQSIYLEEINSLVDGTEPTPENENSPSDLPLVMVVDDNADMREHIQSLLSDRFRIITANNGMDALHKLQLVKPALIVSDIMMPVMDGIGLLKGIKTNKSTTQIPVILLTARAGEESKIEGWETGADDYLVKPFSSRELISRITSQINTSRIRMQAQENLTNIIRQAPVSMMLLKGENFTIDIINEKASEFLELNQKDVLGRPVFEVFPELVNQGVKEILENVYKTGERYIANGLPLYFIKDGKPVTRYFNYTFEPLRNAGGEIDSILGAGVDTTVETLARKKIEEHREELQNLFKQAPVTIVVYKGEDYVVEVANHAALDLWGKTEEEVLGKPFFEISPELRSSQEPLLKKIMSTGESFAGNEIPVSFFRNGIIHHGYFDFVYQPLRAPDDKITGVIAIGSEVTESVEFRMKIEESEKQLKEMANAMPQLVWIAEPDGKVIYYNDRITEFGGVNRLSDREWQWEGLVHPDDQAKTHDAWTNALADKSRYELEHRIQMRDGSYQWFLSRGIPQYDQDGNVKKWFGTATNIHNQKSFATELEIKVRERTEELNHTNAILESKNIELNHQNAELASFTYIASHDLQEPLRKIQAFSNRILSEEGSNFSARSKDYFNRMISASVRMQNLINALLNYSRTTISEKRFVPTDLNQLMQEVLLSLQHLLEENRAVVKYPPLPVVRIIPHQFHQLMSNLITNAIKYQRKGIDPVIQLSASQVTAFEVDSNEDPGTGKYWEISVADNGIGFEQQYEKKIFELFQRLHDEKEYTGTGIGLAICKKIVQNHNGFISAKGNPGVGAVFQIYLPV